MKIGKFSRKRSQWGNSPRNQKICSEIGGKSETEGGNASLPQGGWTPLSSKISHVSPVSDSRGEANPDMTLIQFGYRLWAPSKEEINTRYWKTYQIGPQPNVCIDVHGLPKPRVWIRQKCRPTFEKKNKVSQIDRAQC